VLCAPDRAAHRPVDRAPPAVTPVGPCASGRWVRSTAAVAIPFLIACVPARRSGRAARRAVSRAPPGHRRTSQRARMDGGCAVRRRWTLHSSLARWPAGRGGPRTVRSITHRPAVSARWYVRERTVGARFGSGRRSRTPRPAGRLVRAATHDRPVAHLLAGCACPVVRNRPVGAQTGGRVGREHGAHVVSTGAAGTSWRASRLGPVAAGPAGAPRPVGRAPAG
jgi:hypothetical protein